MADLLTLKEAAARSGLTVSTLRAEAARGRLDLFRIGKRDYTTPADLAEWRLMLVTQRGATGDDTISFFKRIHLTLTDYQRRTQIQPPRRAAIDDAALRAVEREVSMPPPEFIGKRARGN